MNFKEWSEKNCLGCCEYKLCQRCAYEAGQKEERKKLAEWIRFNINKSPFRSSQKCAEFVKTLLDQYKNINLF